MIVQGASYVQKLFRTISDLVSNPDPIHVEDMANATVEFFFYLKKRQNRILKKN